MTPNPTKERQKVEQILKGLDLAEGIIEADLFDAKEHGDPDWVDQAEEALAAVIAVRSFIQENGK